jgi:predicted Zn-dependent protease
MSRTKGLTSLLLCISVVVGGSLPAPILIHGQTGGEKPKESTASQRKKPLSVSEDPAMIGKRNINSGGDRFWGWLGGSQEREIQIGRQISLEIEQQAKMVDDPLVTEYINRVGQQLVLHSDAKIPFTIRVIDSDEVNAFALPGGFFFINKGLILAADNESELAGVMAHEIAHVAARHAMENQGKGQMIGIGLIAGIIFTGGVAGAVLQNTAGLAQALAFFSFSRAAEEEADRLGVQYLYAAGYDPNGMASMFEKLAAQSKSKPNSISKLFSTHPQSIERKDASIALVARFPERDEYKISSSDFNRVKAHLLRMTNVQEGVPGEDDEGDPSKPTLRRRSQEPDPSKGTDDSGKPDEKRPVLKRNTDTSKGDPNKDDQ